MDDKKLEEALVKVEAPTSNRDPSNRLEIRSALTSWSQTIVQMLAGRFGKGKVIHILILAPVGRESQLSWISDADFASCKATFEALVERTKFLEESRIRIPDEYFGG